MKRLTSVLLIFACLVSISFSRPQSKPNTTGKTIQLPEAKKNSSMSVEEALVKMRQVRNFTAQTLSYSQAGQLAWAGYGVIDMEKGTRTVPAFENPDSIRLYFVMDKGVFLYNAAEHSLEMVSNLDIRDRIVASAPPEDMVVKPACLAVVVSEVKMVSGLMGNRIRKMIQLQAGHIAQNIQLQAATMGFGTSTISFFDVNLVRKLCKLQIAAEPVYIVAVGYPDVQPQQKLEQLKEVAKTKTAVLIAANKDYRDEELILTKSLLEQAGVKTFIASSRVGAITGMMGGRAEASVYLNSLNVGDYDAVVFIGGTGAKEYFKNTKALEIARQAKDMNKVLGAICMAPTILANAGVINGLKVTGFPTEQEQIQKGGAVYTGNPLERDGNIITAIGPAASQIFAKAILDAIVEQK